MELIDYKSKLSVVSTGMDYMPFERKLFIYLTSLLTLGNMVLARDPRVANEEVNMARFNWFSV